MSYSKNEGRENKTWRKKMKAGTPVINEAGVIGIVASSREVNGSVFVMFVGEICEVICKTRDLSPVTIGIVPTA
jgi:hypothetical protein